MCLDNPTLPKITAMTAGWPAYARLAAVAPAGQPTRYTTPGDVTGPPGADVCPACSGTGKRYGETYANCGGTGEVTKGIGGG